MKQKKPIVLMGETLPKDHDRDVVFAGLADLQSPTFEAVRKERQIAEQRAKAARRLSVYRTGRELALSQLCAGDVPTRSGWPQTTHVVDERGVVSW